MSDFTEYRVDVHYESDHMWAEVVDLPGCFASGANSEELREALAEAIGMYVSEQAGECQVSELEFDATPHVSQVRARAQLVPA